MLAERKFLDQNASFPGTLFLEKLAYSRGILIGAISNLNQQSVEYPGDKEVHGIYQGNCGVELAEMVTMDQKFVINLKCLKVGLSNGSACHELVHRNALHLTEKH